MIGRNELRGALAIVAAALGIDYVSGRALAAFYAQMGNAGWLGIGLASGLFGLMIGVLGRLARRSGARDIRELLNRLPGGGVGWGMRLIYICILLLSTGMLLRLAGCMGALALPLRRADLLGVALALLAAGTLVLGGGGRLKVAGTALVLLLAAFELGLMLFARLPETPRFAIELRLRNNWIAAVGFAALHVSACLCLSAGLAVKINGGRVRPGRMGACAGVVYALVLGLGNAVLMSGDERALALRMPFVALSADWGSAGFYLSAGLNWLFCVFCFAGLFYGILPVRHGAKYAGK